MFGLQKRILGEFQAAVAAAQRQDAQRTADDRLLGTAGLDQSASPPQNPLPEAIPMASTALLIIAVALVLLAGVFAAADAAVSTVSQARADGLVRLGRVGAKQLALVIADGGATSTCCCSCG